MAWPTTDTPRTEFATLRLTPQEAADLDHYLSSKHPKSNRSAAVREAVLNEIEREKKRRTRKTKKSEEGA